MNTNEDAARLANTLQLLFNALVLGVAADALLDHPGAEQFLRAQVVELPHHTLELAQVADSLRNEKAREQTRREFRKLLFRGAITNAFRQSSDYFGRALTVEERSNAPWYWIAKIVANALSHNFIISVREREIRRHLPLEWGSILVRAEDHGRSVDEILNYSAAIDLLFTLREEVARRSAV